MALTVENLRNLESKENIQPTAFHQKFPPVFDHILSKSFITGKDILEEFQNFKNSQQYKVSTFLTVTALSI